MKFDHCHLFLQLSPKEKVAPGVVAVITSRVNDKFLGVGEDGRGHAGAGRVGDSTLGQGRSWVAFEGCEHRKEDK